MSKVTVFVGLDYHKDSIQVCVMDPAGTLLTNRSCPNDAHAIHRLVAPRGPEIRGAIEACTGLADLADELVTRFGWDLSLAHPGYVHRLKQSPDKSDYSDSKMLADLVRAGYLPTVWLAPAEVRQLRTLVRYRQQLVQERRATKLRVTALLREARAAGPAGRRGTRVWLAWLATTSELGSEARFVVDCHLANLHRLGELITRVEDRLQAVTAGDPVVTQLVALPGIGPVTAIALRAAIGRFDRFRTGKQLARYCGLSPRNASSGARLADAGWIKASNELLRAVLIEAAHRLSASMTAGKPWRRRYWRRARRGALSWRR